MRCALILVVLVATRALASRGIHKEPECSCSRFYYEEQVLEKTIRLGIRLEEMEKSLIKLVHDADKKHSENDKDHQLAIEQSKGKTDRLSEVIEELKKSSTLALEKTDKLSGEIEELKKSSARALDATKTISFSAKLVKDKSVGSNSAFIFTDVIHDHGSSYDVNTGIFTAPVDGTYLFTVQFCVNRNKYVYYSIVVDGDMVVSSNNHEESYETSNTATAIVVLRSTQKVWVKSNLASEVYEDDNDWNVFSGVLIHGTV